MKRSVVCLILVCMVLGLVTTAGCGGCRSAEEIAEEQKKKLTEQKKKPKPNFESPGTSILPGYFPDLETKSTEELKEMTAFERAKYNSRNFLIRNRSKAGHWVATSTPVRANQFNVQGQFDASMLESNNPNQNDNTEFRLSTARPFALTKGEWKYLQSSTYLERRAQAKNANVQHNLLPSLDANPLFTPPLCSSRLMEGFQYHMVVLSNRAQKMKYLNLTDSVKIDEPDSYISGELPAFYFVVTNEPNRPIPLPANALQWTTIAYLVWDDLDPGSLNIDQQQALVDWLHFGGQLILSGPDCLSKLETSFLAQYLPAQSSGRVEFNKSQFEPLNDYWSVPSKRNGANNRRLVITDGNPLVGVELLPHVDASFVDGAGQLVAERPVGRGRVVATGFSLADSRIKSWRSFQTFFHGALLRRPARQFARTSDGILSFRWADDGLATSIFNPLIGSTLRFASRDLAVQRDADINVGRSPNTNINDLDVVIELPHAKRKMSAKNTDYTRLLGGFRADSLTGVAAWSDSGLMANTARETLKQAAGIKPPSATFVLKMLSVYLILLIPANWLLFRAMGKVEWAWVAIPFISIAGAFTVVRMASLDIGFARSNSQVGVLELQPEYARGHLTEYSALYTSLSTNYDVELDNSTGLALPLPTLRNGPVREKTIQQVTLHQSLPNRLDNFLIQSNSTRMMHTECVFDAGGYFELLGGQNASSSDATDSSEAKNSAHSPGEPPTFDFSADLAVNNTTKLDINSAAVVARDSQGDYYVSWIGQLKNGQQKSFELAACQKERILDLWDESQPNNFPGQSAAPTDDSSNEVDRISAYKLLKAVVDHLSLGPGEVRMLGYSNEKFSGNRFIPASTQTRLQTLVLAHLRPASLPKIKRDANSVLDFLRKPVSTNDDSGNIINAEIIDAEDP